MDSKADCKAGYLTIFCRYPSTQSPDRNSSASTLLERNSNVSASTLVRRPRVNSLVQLRSAFMATPVERRKSESNWQRDASASSSSVQNANLAEWCHAERQRITARNIPPPPLPHTQVPDDPKRQRGFGRNRASPLATSLSETTLKERTKTTTMSRPPPPPPPLPQTVSGAVGYDQSPPFARAVNGVEAAVSWQVLTGLLGFVISLWLLATTLVRGILGLTPRPRLPSPPSVSEVGGRGRAEGTSIRQLDEVMKTRRFSGQWDGGRERETGVGGGQWEGGRERERERGAGEWEGGREKEREREKRRPAQGVMGMELCAATEDVVRCKSALVNAQRRVARARYHLLAEVPDDGENLAGREAVFVS